MTKYNCTLPKLRTYKGARYVPIFAEPLQWDDEREYEWLTVVYNCGRTYISRTTVPAGSPLPEYPLLSNEWWATYADYNAQIEQYRAEVRAFSTRYDKMYCYLKDQIKVLDEKVENYYTEINERITEEVNNLTNVFNEKVENLEQTFNTMIEQKGDSIASIVEKVYLGGTVNEDGTVDWPTDDKIAIGNMNWYSGASNQNYIKTASDGDGDMRAE